MNTKKKRIYLIITTLLCAILMTLVDGVIQPPYFVKSFIKVILFLAVPLIYYLINKDELKNLKTLFTPKLKSILISFGLGISVLIVILGGYFLLRGVIDFSGITKNLTEGANVNKDNFIYVAIYITLINSLLEEFFFRGYAFLNLKNIIPRKIAYSISAGLFALYHVGMTLDMFNPVLFVITFIGLYLGGVVFNILNEKSNNIYTSWIVHMFANLAINTIGLILFGII